MLTQVTTVKLLARHSRVAASSPTFGAEILLMEVDWGKFQWSNKTDLVERTISWLGGLGRFRIRYDRDQQIIHAWNHLALAALCYRILMRKSV